MDDILDNHSGVDGMAVQLSKIFHCEKLQGTLAYATCLKRQKMMLGMTLPYYPECNPPCPHGEKIRKMFPKYDMKAAKKVKNISLKPGDGQRQKRKPKGAGVKNACPASQSHVSRPAEEYQGKVSARARGKDAEHEKKDNKTMFGIDKTEKNDCRASGKARNINFYDLELVLKAQMAYIMELVRDGRLAEAVNKLKQTAGAV